MPLEHAGVLPPEESGLISSDPHGRAALAHQARSMRLDFEAPGLTFRNGIFDDPRAPVTDQNELQSYPLRTVVSISLSYEAPDGLTEETGSGFLAGPRHVITNRHVADVDGVDVNVWLDNPPPFFDFDVFPGRSELAPLNGGAWPVERVVWNPFPETEHNDYALLILEDDVERSGQYGRLGLCSASGNTLDGLQVDTAGYPAANFTCGQTPDPPTADNDCPCGGGCTPNHARYPRWTRKSSYTPASLSPASQAVHCGWTSVLQTIHGAPSASPTEKPIWIPQRCVGETTILNGCTATFVNGLRTTRQCPHFATEVYENNHHSPSRSTCAMRVRLTGRGGMRMVSTNSARPSRVSGTISNNRRISLIVGASHNRGGSGLIQHECGK